MEPATVPFRSSPDAAASTQPAWISRAGTAAILLVALLARLPGLTESLWYDELWSTRVKVGTLGDTLRVALTDIHPPLYGLISHGWMRLFGDSELSVRMLPLLAGLLTVALLPALGRALATERAGWLAAVFLALSPVHIWYSQEARPYSLIMLLVVLLPLAWDRANRVPESRSAAAWFVLTCIALSQLHYFAIALPVAFVITSMWQHRRRALAFAGFGLAAAGVAALLLIKSNAGSLVLESGYLRTFTPGDAWSLATSWFLLGGSVAPDASEGLVARVVAWTFLALCLTGFVAWAIRGAVVTRDARWSTHLLLLLAVPGLLTTMTLLGRGQFYIERSALPSLPFFFLAVSSGLWLLRWRTGIQRAVVAATVVGSFAILLHHYDRRERWTVYKPNPDWRSIITPLAAQAAQGQRIVVASTTRLTELLYYMPGSGECDLEPSDDQTNPSSAGLRATLARSFPRSRKYTCGAAGTASVRLYVKADSNPAWIDSVSANEPGSRAFVVLNHRWLGRTPALIRQLRASGVALGEVARASGLEVYSVDPR
ncbi:MAG TPA: glycosyltransferase family 39 protein [Gemmatimonadaceae bacterium]